MSQKLPMISGKEAVKAFTKAGWHLDRISGSHAILRKKDLQLLFRFRYIRN